MGNQPGFFDFAAAVVAWAAASGEGEVVTAPCRKLWWWILLSCAALIGGMNVQRLLLQALGR